jgi:hypothetical protein
MFCDAVFVEALVSFHTTVTTDNTTEPRDHQNFALLTEWAEKNHDIPWETLNSHRLALMVSVRQIALELLDPKYTIIQLPNDSALRCSDIDVIVSGPEAAALCVVMVYCLGLLSERLVGRSGTDTVSASFEGLQRLLDIELYSSSGVIRVAPTVTTRGVQSGLHEIENGLFQMVRQVETTDWFYRVLVSYLWMQLTQGDTILRRVRLLVGDAHARHVLSELLKARSLSRKDRFSIQIAASAESSILAQLVFRTTDELQRLDLLLRWEHMETLANVMSPESTVAPATFVDVVVGGQLKMRSRTVLGTRDLYLVLLENLGFMEMYLVPWDGNVQLYKAYKYATRACGAYTRMNCARLRSSSREDVGWVHMYKWKLYPSTDLPWLRLMTPVASATDPHGKRLCKALAELFQSLCLAAASYIYHI